MNIIPILKCSDFNASLAFYTGILGFEVLFVYATEDQKFHYGSVTLREQELHLSTFGGDGVFGTDVYIRVDEVDDLFRNFVQRGLVTTGYEHSPVHRGPVDQTWNMREFYVDDPDGNTIRFGAPIN